MASAPEIKASLRVYAGRAKDWLFNHALPFWGQRGFDLATRTFHERLSLSGEPVFVPRQIRVQALQTAVFARAARLGWLGSSNNAVEAGLSVLLDKGIRPDGGTRHLLDATCIQPIDDRRDLYDTAFVLLGLAEASIASGGSRHLLATAERLTRWIEINWSHSEGGSWWGILCQRHHVGRILRLACCRFRGHRDWVFHDAGGGPWEDDGSDVSSKSRLCA